MDTAHDQFTRDQYGPRAAAYLASAVHAHGDDLDQIAALAARLRPRRVLDLGCGGGHVAYRVAPLSGQVVACDLTPDMLDVVAAEAAARGIANLTTQVAAADRLPFADASFDLLLCRFSAHHWADLPAGLREARRVLASGGHALFIDSIAPSAALLDSHLQAIELLRDISHVRNYRAEEWCTLLAAAGLPVTGLVRRRLHMKFADWIARTSPSDSHVAALLSLQRTASPDAKAHFEIEPDGSWMLDTLALEAGGR